MGSKVSASIVILVLQLLVVSQCKHLSPGGVQEEECDLCQQKRMLQTMTPDEVRALQLEGVKAVILDKLRMAAPPNTTGKVSERMRHSLKHVARQLRRNTQTEADQPAEKLEEYYARPKEVVRFADTGKGVEGVVVSTLL